MVVSNLYTRIILLTSYKLYNTYFLPRLNSPHFSALLHFFCRIEKRCFTTLNLASYNVGFIYSLYLFYHRVTHLQFLNVFRYEFITWTKRTRDITWYCLSEYINISDLQSLLQCALSSLTCS